VIVANIDDLPGGFEYWEPMSSGGNVLTNGKLAVDRFGRRWESVGGNWQLADRGTMNKRTWEDHMEGHRKAQEEGRSRMTTGSATTGSAAPATEATGVRSLVARLDQIASQHTQIGGNEGFAGSLQRMEVGAGDQQKVAEAQEASKLAAQAWKTAAETVRRNNLTVQEAYQNSPDAGNKHANTNE
jgi:hypothetical protein